MPKIFNNTGAFISSEETNEELKDLQHWSKRNIM